MFSVEVKKKILKLPRFKIITLHILIKYTGNKYKPERLS